MAQRIADDVGQRPFEQGGIGEHVRQCLGDVDLDAPVRCPGAADRGEGDLLDTDRLELDVQRRRLQATHVEQVADDRRQPIGLLLDGLVELGDRVRRPVDVALTKAGDRRLDRRQGGAQVVGDGLQQ